MEISPLFSFSPPLPLLVDWSLSHIKMDKVRRELEGELKEVEEETGRLQRIK